MKSSFLARAAVATATAACISLCGCGPEPVRAASPTSTPTPIVATGATNAASSTKSSLAFSPSRAPLPAGAAMPAFSGPYAADFERAYRDSLSDLQRQVLQDGRITEAEIVALQDDCTQCMAGAGITQVEFNDEGGFSIKAPDGVGMDQVNDAVAACQDVSIRPVDMIYRAQLRNPEKKDEASLMAACLVRVRLVEPGYTAADYARDAPDKLPFDVNSPEFSKCVKDPLNAGR